MNPSLTSKIEALLSGQSVKALSRERERLTQQYKGSGSGNEVAALSSETQRLAYLAARLPATYAAIYQVLQECLKRSRGASIASLLDIGAGPGTALLAAAELLPLSLATMLERDRGFIALGEKLALDLEGIEKNWICQDVSKNFNSQPHDLVIASYALGELKEKDRLQLVEKLWGLTQKFLILIEPGSKAGFESLMTLRQSLLLQGGHLIAPCPHSERCPLQGIDWCHFAARVQRTSLHRKTKDATLNYEDEKFSYLIFSRNPYAPCQSRIIRRPLRGEGFVKLQLCGQTGIEEKTITKKNKTDYSHAKKLDWGNEFNLNLH